MTRVLIAEEEPRISSFIEKGLRERGYATAVASRGPDALRLARTGTFDLLILDLGLPGIDGLEVLREFRRHDVNLPVLVVSGRPSMTQTLARLPSPAVGYISKPFRFEELLDSVEKLLSESSQP
jgi:two-component system, OmpR family, copper resistance phosphate regulon response regulator CusR